MQLATGSGCQADGMLRPKCVRIQTIQSSCCASTACTSRAIGTGSPRIRSSCCVSMAGICNACVYRAVVAPRSQADRIAGSQHDELKRTRCFVPKACVHKAAAVLAVPESGCQAGSVALPHTFSSTKMVADDSATMQNKKGSSARRSHRPVTLNWGPLRDPRPGAKPRGDGSRKAPQQHRRHLPAGRPGAHPPLHRP